MLKKLITLPLSWFYGIAVSIRNYLFDKNILKSKEFDIPVICVGNITVGGTGKTPHTEYIVKALKGVYNIAILSRGYKRVTKGFRFVEERNLSKEVGDEPKQMKLKFPDIPVAVCEKRVDGINILRRKFKSLNLVVMDDGMQHRYVETWLNIMLMDYNRPIYQDHLLPYGSLREGTSAINRAQVVIVTKCPDDIKPIDMRLVAKSLKLSGFHSLFFTRMRSMPPRAIYPESIKIGEGINPDANVVAMSGVGNPVPFIESVAKNFNIVATLTYPDHHSYKTKDLNAMKEALEKGGENTFIITTEKDATKLSKSGKIPEEIKRTLYYIPIEVEFIESYRNNTEQHFLDAILPYVKKNHKYSMVN